MAAQGGCHQEFQPVVAEDLSTRLGAASGASGLQGAGRGALLTGRHAWRPLPAIAASHGRQGCVADKMSIHPVAEQVRSAVNPAIVPF